MARVLVVEDDERIGRLVTRALASDGHDTEHVSTGTEGLAAALANDFELVILDLRLPGMAGGEVLERLVRERPEEPVLVLSAVPDIGARVAALEAGAADFLGKPFAVAELLARVRARLRPTPAGATSGTLRTGPVTRRWSGRRIRTRRPSRTPRWCWRSWTRSRASRTGW